MKRKDLKRPEWVPDNDSSDHFASHVVAGLPSSDVIGSTTGRPRTARARLTSDDYVKGVLGGDRTILARAITLVESNAGHHRELADHVLQEIMGHSGQAVRVGVSGVPGAGKSTFIEALGCELCNRGHKVAVLAVDPSSTRSGGSILGDKTRMEELARRPEAFIRPSPSGGNLGGVASKSRETMLLCEAAGFDTVLVETVGVGQSEVTVRSMVDFFLLLQIAGAGDELQGIKKGVLEIADAVVVNKADGDNLARAKMARAEYERVFQFLTPETEGWQPRALTCSALRAEGVTEVWQMIVEFIEATRKTGLFERRRSQQQSAWFESLLAEAARQLFYNRPDIATRLPILRQQVSEAKIPPVAAVRELLAQPG